MLHRGARRGAQHIKIGDGQRIADVTGNRADRTTGGQHGFYVVSDEKIHILFCVFADDLAPARAVGHAAGIAEVEDTLVRQGANQLPHGGEAAKAGVKYADGSVIHKLRLALVFTRKSAVDELFKQLAVRGTGVFPELRVHADGREARQRVDLV